MWYLCKDREVESPEVARSLSPDSGGWSDEQPIFPLTKEGLPLRMRKLLRNLPEDASWLLAIYGDILGWSNLASSRSQLLLGFTCTQWPIGPALLPNSKRPWNAGRLLLGRRHSSASPSVQSCFLSISSTLVGSQGHSLTNVWQTHLHLRACFVGRPNRGS